MQNCELYRRGVVLPLDEQAEEQLRANDVSRDTNVRFLEIPDQAVYEALWRLGLFNEINERCEGILDDYEEEMIEASSVPKVVAVVNSLPSPAADESAVVEFLRELKALATQASTLSRPLLFVL